MTDFYWGLSLFLAGCGLNVTCVNCMLTQLFESHDKRRETAFLWNYSGMNVGFFVGFAISGFFQLRGEYQQLFVLSSIGNIIAITLALLRWRSLHDIDTKMLQLSHQKRRLANFNGVMMIGSLILALRWLLEHSVFSSNLIMCSGIVMGIIMFYIALKQKNEERNKIFAYMVLALTSLVFWTLYQVAPMGLTLFIDRNVDRHFLGFLFAPQWVQNINTVVIILGGPLLSVFFNRLRDRGIHITIPMQFSVALILIGIGFAILPIGIHFSNSEGLIDFNWIMASFILQSLGELFISPIGYAMVGQFAPKHLQGIMMGTWLMITGVAATLSGYFSSIALGKSQSVDPLITNISFSYTFGMLGFAAIMTGILLLFLIPYVLHLTQERKLFFKATS
jgi:POT family proton-dependent oligopeptide transporter